MAEAWVWVFTALVGLVFSAMGVHEALHDLRAVKENGLVRYLAKSGIRREYLRVAVQVGFLLSGLATIATWAFVNVRYVLISSQVILVANTVWDYRLGRRIRANQNERG